LDQSLGYKDVLVYVDDIVVIKRHVT